MTVYTQYYSNPECLVKIDKRNYRPEPQVNGAMVNFNLKKSQDREFDKEEETPFFKFVNIKLKFFIYD